MSDMLDDAITRMEKHVGLLEYTMNAAQWKELHESWWAVLDALDAEAAG